MVLADCLSHLLADAKKVTNQFVCNLTIQSPNPIMFTAATLTGHAVQSWGCYSVLVENGQGKRISLSHDLQRNGEVWGDPFEVSSYRREDVLEATDVTHDVVQHQSGKPRGHQFAMGFLVIASGLSEHGRCNI